MSSQTTSNLISGTFTQKKSALLFVSTCRLGKIPANNAVEEGMAGQYDFVHVFVYNQNDLSRLAPEAIRALKHDGLLWISYPKISSKMKSDLNRDKGWGPVTEAGMAGIAQIAIDEVWSALRFRPRELVRKTR